MGLQTSNIVSVTLFILTCLLSSSFLTAASLNTTVRASNCIANTTHCHCDFVAAKESSVCLKPIIQSPGKCSKGHCAAGYRCDCNSDVVCVKRSRKSYQTTDTTDATTVDCTWKDVMAPQQVSGFTTDFHIVAHQEFQVFVNNQEVGYGEANVYKVLTAEIKEGDVVAVTARRHSKDEYGIKLKFRDLQNEVRVIDENWYGSSKFEAGWLDKEFDPVAQGWSRPSIAANIHDDNFDKDVPWMWLESADTVYMRYQLPSSL